MVDTVSMPKTTLSARGRWFGNRFRVVRNNRMWELNETGAFIWSVCDGARTVERVLIEVSDHFQCTRQDSDPSTLSFLEFLAQNGLITFEGGSNA